MVKENFFLLKPFGPSVVKMKIPENFIKELNKYVEEVVKSEEKSYELDHGSKLAGQVTQEFELETNFMQKSGWGNFLGAACNKWIEHVYNKKISKFEIISSWIVRQFKNEYNPTHWHGGHISGVGYLKVPSNLGKINKNKKKSNINGCLQLIHGSKMFMSDSVYTIKPEVGDFYLFPNYLMHVVFPFLETNEERRSVSFNARIDTGVYET